MDLLVSRRGIGNLGKESYEDGFYLHKIHAAATSMGTRDIQHSLFGTILSSHFAKTAKDMSLLATTE